MIKNIYAIEISGVCNMGCPYCPYRLQQRPRGLMSWDTLYKILDLITSGRVVANKPLHLHLFGEPMLHPEFEEMAAAVKEVWPHISFSTNGKGLTYERARKINDIGFEWVTVSPHDMRVASTAYYMLKSMGVEVMLHRGPDHSWAGQVEIQVKWRYPCEFWFKNKAVVRWNGDVAVCCITDSQEGVVGNVWDDDLLERDLPEISLCKTCHLERRVYADLIGEAMPDDRARTMPDVESRMHGV